MIKRMLTGLLALALLAVPLAPALKTGDNPLPIRLSTVAAQPLGNGMFWWFQLRDERNQPVTDAARCFVYTAGGDTLATIYTDATLATAASNPITAATLFNSTGQSCAFYTALSVTSVDVIAWTKRARSRFSGYTPAGSAGHVLILNQQMNTKIIQIPYAAGPATLGSYMATGVTIPKGFAIKDILVQVTNAGSGNNTHLVAGIYETHAAGLLSFGSQKVGDMRGNTVNGQGVNVSTLGWFAATGQVTTWNAILTPLGVLDHVFTSFHTGSLISRGAVGNNLAVAATPGHAGSYFRFPFIGDGTNKTVVYHVGTSSQGTIPFGAAAAATNPAGYFYIIGAELGLDY